MNTILHSRIIGSGEPLLILHGFLGMSDNWKTLGTKYAENGYQVHLIDQRNHGKSFHSSNFNYDILAHDTKQYMNHHKLKEASIIGHSMGGKTAMQFACNNPSMISKLVVADIAPKYYPPHHHDIINGLNALDFDTISSRKEADSELSKHITQYSTRQFLLKNLYWAEKGKLGFRCNLAVLSHKMEEIGENIGSTSSYEGPTLFLKGDRSEYISENDTLAIKSHFHGAKLDTIENAGHWLHAENATQFLKKSITFLDQ